MHLKALENRDKNFEERLDCMLEVVRGCGHEDETLIIDESRIDNRYMLGHGTQLSRRPERAITYSTSKHQVFFGQLPMYIEDGDFIRGVEYDGA